MIKREAKKGQSWIIWVIIGLILLAILSIGIGYILNGKGVGIEQWIKNLLRLRGG